MLYLKGNLAIGYRLCKNFTHTLCHPFNRPERNIFKAADTRQEQAEKRSLCMTNEHLEFVLTQLRHRRQLFNAW